MQRLVLARSWLTQSLSSLKRFFCPVSGQVLSKNQTQRATVAALFKTTLYHLQEFLFFFFLPLMSLYLLFFLLVYLLFFIPPLMASTVVWVLCRASPGSLIHSWEEMSLDELGWPPLREFRRSSFKKKLMSIFYYKGL